MRIPEKVEVNDLEPRTWPQIWLQKDFWMVADGKRPVNPTKPLETRYSWGKHPENWTSFDTVSKWLIDPQMKCLIMLVRKQDGFVFINGDDVRDPETGKIDHRYLAQEGRSIRASKSTICRG